MIIDLTRRIQITQWKQNLEQECTDKIFPFVQRWGKNRLEEFIIACHQKGWAVCLLAKYFRDVLSMDGLLI